MDIMQAVANYGLPAIIAFFLLSKTTKSIDNLTAAVNHQAHLLQVLLWEAQKQKAKNHATQNHDYYA